MRGALGRCTNPNCPRSHLCPVVCLSLGSSVHCSLRPRPGPSGALAQAPGLTACLLPLAPDRSNACNFTFYIFLIFYTFLRVNFACKNYTFACKFWGVNYTRWGVNYTPCRVNYTRIFCELHSVSVHFQLDFPHVCGAFEPKQHPPLSQNSIRLYSIAYIGLCFFCFL